MRYLNKKLTVRRDNNVDFHPLDWASHLRQSLVFDPVPTVLTLMLVSSHYYACSYYQCPSATDSIIINNASSFHHIPGLWWGANETSVLGLLFAGISTAAQSAREGKLSLTLTSSLGCIHTPLSLLKIGNNQVPEAADREKGPRESESQQRPTYEDASEFDDDLLQPVRGEESGPISFADGVLRVSMTDPFTIAYNAWTYIANGNNVEDGTVVPLLKPEEENTHRVQLPDTLSSSRSTLPHISRQCNDHAPNIASHPQFDAPTIWTDVCILHGIGICSVCFALLPSVFAPGAFLPCFAAVPHGSGCKSNGSSPAWPLIHAAVLMFCLSLLGCCAIHHVLHMHSLALCTAIHVVPRFVCVCVSVCVLSLQCVMVTVGL